MTRNENKSMGIRHSVTTLLKVLCVSSLLLVVSMKNVTIMGEGFFIVEEVSTISIDEGEPGSILCIQDDLLYVNLKNYTEGVGYRNIVQIIDVHQPENPVVVGRYELEFAEWLFDFKIRENTAYMLTELAILGPYCSVVLLNVTDPTNPVRIGDSDLVEVSMLGVAWSEQIGVYNNYSYISSFDELEIFDCSNQTLPVRVDKLPSSGGNLHIKNDLLYLVWNGVKIYSIIDPVNPTYQGEVNSIKHGLTGSGMYGNYVITAFNDSGVQVYDCTNPTQPTICEDYDFPDWQLYIDGTIQDIAITGERLFTGGKEVYVFDISKPQKLKRITRLTIGHQNLSQIIVANNYLYLTIDSNIIIYSYVENSLGRNFGIGIGVGLPIVVGTSLYFRWKKKKSGSTN